MESFNTYYEKFSLNPLKWFRRELSASELKMKEDARKKASLYIPKLKQILKDRGYSIHKHDFAYTVRKDRKLGLSKKDTMGDKTKYSNPLNNINYIKAWFSLAHETGHVLQWNEETDTNEKFDEFFQEIREKKFEFDKEQVLHIHKLWYELDAWVKGMSFIPSEYRSAYKQYAFNSYKTYMNRSPKYYYNTILLRNLLYKLNMEDHV